MSWFRLIVALVISLLLASSASGKGVGDLSCGRTTYYNYTGFEWTRLDQFNIYEAQQMCSDFNPRRPCLFRFFKLGINVYSAQCYPRWVIGFRSNP